MKTLIALTAKDTSKNNGKYTSQQSYMNALESVDANYVTITPNAHHDYDFVAQICDGLLLTGGRDLDPKYYHEELHEKTNVVSKEIDEMEMKLVEVFIRHKKPILGICRGFQVINVYYGGTLYQDIPSQYDTLLHHSQSEDRNVPTHQVVLTKDSFLGKKDEVVHVNSFHHQAIDQVGKSLEVIAISEDGIIEAIQNEDIMAVQWHPECLIEFEFHKNIFQSFLKKCQK